MTTRPVKGKPKKKSKNKPSYSSVSKGCQAQGSILSEDDDSLTPPHGTKDQMTWTLNDNTPMSPTNLIISPSDQTYPVLVDFDGVTEQQLNERKVGGKPTVEGVDSRNLISVHISEQIMNNNVSTDQKVQQIVTNNNNNNDTGIPNTQSPNFEGTHHLSSSLGMGSIDRGGTPWLVPVVSQISDQTQGIQNNKNDVTSTTLNAQQIQEVQEPKIIDIMINDQEKTHTKISETDSASNNATAFFMKEDFGGAGVGKIDSKKSQRSKQQQPGVASPTPNLAKQIHSIKNRMQRKSDSSRTSHYGNGAVTVKTSTIGAKKQQQIDHNRSSSYNNQRFNNIVVSPRESLKMQQKQPDFLESEGFLQISQKQMGVNKDVQALRSKQLQSMNINNTRQQRDLLSCMTQPSKQAADNINQLDQHQQTTTRMITKAKTKPMDYSVQNQSSTNWQAVQQNKNSTLRGTQHSGGIPALQLQNDEDAMLSNAPHSQVGSHQQMQDIMTVDQVTIPDVFIRRKDRPIDHNGGAAGVGIQQIMLSGHDQLSHERLNKIQSAMSEITQSGASSSVNSRSHHAARDHFLRNHTLQLNALSDIDQQEVNSPFHKSKPRISNAKMPVRQQVMQRTKKNPVKINKFIEKFGSGAVTINASSEQQQTLNSNNQGAEAASTSQDLTNFFSARENIGRLKISETVPSARPKTSERGHGIHVVAKSFDTISPKSLGGVTPHRNTNKNIMFSHREHERSGNDNAVGLPININMKRRYTAQRSRRAQIMSLQNGTTATGGSRGDGSMSLKKQFTKGRTSRAQTIGQQQDLGLVSQSTQNQQNFQDQFRQRTGQSSDGDEILTIDNTPTTAKKVGIFQEKPVLNFDPSVFSSRNKSASNYRGISNNKTKVNTQAASQNLQKTSLTNERIQNRNEERNQTFSWDQLRARDKNLVHLSFSAQDPSYRRVDNLKVNTKQPLPKSHVKVPDLLKSQLNDSAALQTMQTMTNSAEFQNLMSSRLYSQLDSGNFGSDTNNKTKIRVLDLKGSHMNSSKEEDQVMYSDRSNVPDQQAFNIQDQHKIQSLLMKSQNINQLESINDSLNDVRNNEIAALQQQNSNNTDTRLIEGEENSLAHKPMHSSSESRMRDGDVGGRVSKMQETKKPQHGYPVYDLKQENKHLKTENQEVGKDSNLDLMNLESDSVSKISSLSMRVDSKIFENQISQDHDKATPDQIGLDQSLKKGIKKSKMHKLQSRIDGKFLPLSVDLLPSNELQRAIYKLKQQNFEEVVGIGVRELTEENFVSRLHGVEVAKIDKILHQTKDSQKPTEDTSKTNDTPSVDIKKGQKNDQQETASEHQVSLSLTLSEDNTPQKVSPIRCYMPEKARVEVKNPLYQLSERPPMLDILFNDAIKVYEANCVDIFAYKSEDYLDDIRRVTDMESVSLDVRIAHDLMNLWVHYIKPIEQKKINKRQQRKRKFAQNAAFNSTHQFSQASMASRKNMKVVGSEMTQYVAPNTKQDSGSIAMFTNKTGGNTVKNSMLDINSSDVSSSKKNSFRSMKDGNNKNSKTTIPQHILKAIKDARQVYSLSTEKDSTCSDAVSKNTEQREDALKHRTIRLNLYEANSLKKVSVKLEVDFEAILKLQRKIEAYSQRRIQNVLPLYIYDDYSMECQMIQKEILRRRSEDVDPIKCVVTMKDDNERRVQEIGEVLDYDWREQLFIVEIDLKRYFMNRLCIQFEDFETNEEINDRRVQAMQLSKQVLLRMNIELILYQEVIKLRPDLHQPAEITNNIERRADLDRLSRLKNQKIPDSAIRQLVQQFESIYCFAMLKSIVMSETEQEHPNYASMITGYKVESDKVNDTPYYGLKSFEKNKGPIDHLIKKKDCIDFLNSFSLLGRVCFQQAFKYITLQTLTLLEPQPVFQVPIQEETAFSMIIKPQFKKIFKNTNAMISKTQEYPLEKLDFCLVQQEIAKNFHKIVVNKWQENIIRHVQKILIENFKQTRNSFLTKDISQINPYIVRFLKSVYQLQVNHLFSKFEGELTNYLEFLLKFANQCESFRSKQSYLDYKFDKIDVMYSEKCLIKSEVQVAIVKAKKETEQSIDLSRQKATNPFKQAMRKLRPMHASQQMVTTPSQEDIYKQLYRVLNGISTQFLGIPTVHQQIYKFANLGKKTFVVSTDLGDKRFNLDSLMEEAGFQSVLEGMSQQCSMMSHKELASKDNCYILRKQIEFVIVEIVEQVNQKINQLKPFVKFIGYKFDDMIFDLKSLLFQNQMDTKMQNEEDDFQAMLNFDNNEALQDDQLILMIHKTEITDHTYQFQYKELEEAYWNVQEAVEDWYNFGIIKLDCRKFKQEATDGLKQLLQQFQDHLLAEFLKDCQDQTEKNDKIWQKVKAEHMDIDDVINQIDYINIMRQEEVYDEMIQFVRFLGLKKKFLDQLRIAVPDDNYREFLELHHFPSFLQSEISKKAKILRIEQKKISRMIATHTQSTKKELGTYSKKFKFFREVKLPTKSQFLNGVTELTQNYVKATMDKMMMDGLGTDLKDVVWDSQMVEDQVEKIRTLNETLAKVEQDCKVINRRQEALQMKIADFPELYNLKQEIRPCVQLWETIAQYNQVIEEWKNKPIQKMTLEEIEDFCNDWYRKLLFVMRNSALVKFPGPKQFANYIMREIENLREYLPLLQCLKVKGLDKRHLSQINKDLDDPIILSKINFRWLAQRELHKGKKFDHIKMVTDQASKEYAIKLTIEAIEQEVENSKMTAQKYKDSMILKNLPRDMANFVECDLKITSIAHNAYARIFKDRIEHVQKDLKRIIYFFQVWNDLQKYWAYLLPIFCQKDIAHHMPEQYEKFTLIDRLYREEVQNTESKCKTYKQFCKRESLRHNVPTMMQTFEYLMKCLIKYLEAKREYFPRLYFLSNEQIIEIVGMLEDISQLEKNLFKMFEGIDKLIIVYDEDYNNQSEQSYQSFGDPGSPQSKKVIWRAQDTTLFKQGLACCLGQRPIRDMGQDLGRILGVSNQQGEVLEFKEDVKITQTIEYWLKRVESSMKYNVSRTTQQCYFSYKLVEFIDWTKLWPTQFLVNVLEIKLTQRMSEIFDKKEEKFNHTKVGKSINNAFGYKKEPVKLIQNAQGAMIQPSLMLKTIYNELHDQIGELTMMIRDQLSNSVRQCINTLIINRVHSRDVIRNMINSGVEKSTDFLWNIHMRYEFTERTPITKESEAEYRANQYRMKRDRKNYSVLKTESSKNVLSDAVEEEETKDNPNSTKKSKTGGVGVPGKSTNKHMKDIRLVKEKMALKELGSENYPSNLEIKMVEAVQPYGYELLPNTSRLVISPLTERCFQSLFLALHFKYGGAPIGPAGTGKTESIKEMGKNIARHCFIFNCQSQIDYQSMSKFFKGLAANGTWVCFDEFNRLEIHVLSIISQLIVALSKAKHDDAETIHIEGTNLPFNQNCGLFITMNPFHFGRTPLPDNLKALFRQITMVVPDTLFIAEILLYSVGFREARNLAFKITRTFALIQEQLRYMQHYDFGLRTIKSVLIYAGEVKLRCMKVKSKANINADNADFRLIDHLNNIKKTQVPKKKRGSSQAKSKASLNKSIMSKILSQDGGGEVDSPKLKNIDGGAKLTTGKSVSQAQRTIDGSIDILDGSIRSVDLSQDNTQSVIVETIEEESSLEGSDSDSKSSSGSSTQERIRAMTDVAKDSNGQDEDADEEKVNDSDGSSGGSVISDLNKLDELGLDRKYLIKELGCDSKKVLTDEDLLDQFIVLKSIVDKNLPKLIFRDISILQNIVSDVFPNIPMSQLINNNHVMQMIEQRLERRQLYRGGDFIQNIFNIYEAIISRHGIMVVGRPTSGKTTSIRMLQDTLNTLHMKEYSEKKVRFMKAKAQKMGIQVKVLKNDVVPKDVDLAQENEFALSDLERQLVLDTCIFKGISNFTLNPKSVTMSQLMGFFDETSREWTDGVLSHGIRMASTDTSGKRMLITCDGPIEPDWVENMNSVLDDNKRLSLITGETLYLTPVMNIILEASKLDDCTPATISRCAICYIRKETLPAKAQFNHWLSTLPKILKDQQERLDLYSNYFITDIFQNFMVPDKMIYPVTQSWAIMTFIRIFDSLIYQYRNEKYNDQRSLKKVNNKIFKDAMEADQKKKTEMAKQVKKQEIIRRKFETTARLKHLERTNSISGTQRSNLEKKLVKDGDLSDSSLADFDSSIDEVEEEDSETLSNSRLGLATDLDSESYNSRAEKREESGALSPQSSQFKKSNSQLSGSQAHSKAGSRKIKKQKTEKVTSGQPELFKTIDKEKFKLKPPDHSFVENDALFENSIKNKNYWIDAFFLYSLIWAFGSLLNEKGRRDFNSWMLTAMKNKDLTRKELAAQVNLNSSGSSQKSETDEEKIKFSSASSQTEDSDASELAYVATEDFVIGQVDHMEASLPFNMNVFDAFFDVQTGQFQNWQSVLNYNAEEKSMDNKPKKQLLSCHVTTQDNLRIEFLFDRILEIKKPILIFGPTAQGKSTFMRNYVTENDNNTKVFNYDMMSFSNITTCQKLYQLLEHKLTKASKVILQPPDEKHQMFFIDDIHMSRPDRWKDQSANELLRQQLDAGGWYNTDKIYFKKVRDINFVASISTRQAGKEIIDERLGWHFCGIGIMNNDGGHLEQIYKFILSKAFVHCNSSTVAYSAPTMVLEASLEFYDKYREMVKPSPTSFLFKINWRHILYILKGILEVPNNYYKNMDNIAILWVNEVCRTVLDRYTDPREHERHYNKLCEIAARTFKVRRKIFSEDCLANQFFYGQPESENQYNEIVDEKKLTLLLVETMNDYNKSNPQEQINVIIFNSIIEKTLKINRAIQIPYANTILIADQGSGASELCKLSIKLARASENQLFANDSELLEDWQGQFKSIIQRVGLETKSRAVLHLIERDFVTDVMETLEALAAHGELFQFFTLEELESLLNQTRYKTFSTNHRGKERTESQTKEEIRDLVHQNLHLLIQLTPRSQVLLTQMRDAPHLLDSSTLIYFGEWSDDGFEFIANKHLNETHEDDSQLIRLKDTGKLSTVMIQMYHDTVFQSQLYYQDTDHYVYISPQQFEMFVTSFKRLFQKRSAKILKHRERFRVGLEGIRRTQTYTEAKQEELSKKSPQLVAKQRDLEKLIDQLDIEKSQISKQIKLVLQIENDTVYYLKLAEKVQEQCDKLMQEATPVFKHAVEGLLQITKKEIDELKTIVRPLSTIRTLLTAVCLILDVSPTVISNKETNYKNVKCYWTAAISSKLMGDRNIIHRMTQIDPTKIQRDTMVALEKLIDTGEISAEKVQKATFATRGIFSWVMAVRNYFYVYKTSEPLRNKLILADLQHEEYKMRKVENEARLKELEDKLMDLRDLHAHKEDEIKLFQKEIEEVFMMKSKSARLLNELAGEKQKWMVCEDVATQNISNLEGDSLISAAMVCFLAPFTQKTRDHLYTKWLIKIADNMINITKKLNFNSMFSDPLKIKGWLDNGLPNDSYSIQNAIILKHTQMQPVLIDPQTQANKWLRNELKEVKILNMQTSRFLQELKFCIKFGNTVVIENVDETISSKLYPLFLFEKLKQAGVRKLNMQIMMDSTVTQIDPGFKMYITSVHKSPDFGADLSLLANFINFSVTIEAFEAQILALILAELETEQDAKQRVYRRQALVWIKRLRTIEDEILDELKKPQPQELLIKREFLIEKLMESRTVTKQTGKTLMEINNSMKLLMSTSKLYKPVSQRAAKFFFVANDLVKLNNMYQFTHEWFIGFFRQLVKETIIVDNSQKKKEEAIRKMQANFVRVFFIQVCQTLFDCDKLLFSFLLAYKELEVEFQIDKRQVEFFIKGALQQEEEIFSPKFSEEQKINKEEEYLEQLRLEEERSKLRQKVTPWINASQWKAIDKLSQIPPFNQCNISNNETSLASHIENNPRVWFNYINGNQLLDYTMANFSTKDDDGNSIHSSDEDTISPGQFNKKRGDSNSSVSGDATEQRGDDSDITDPNLNVQSFSSETVSSQGEKSIDTNGDIKEKVKKKKKAKKEEESCDSDSSLDMNGVQKGRKIDKKTIKRVNTQRFLDLGVPGGYERFNYEDAIRQGIIALQLEAEVKQRIAEGLRKIMLQGQTVEKTKQQKMLDDIFAMDGEDSKYTSEEELEESSEQENKKRTGNLNSDTNSQDGEIEDVDDAFEDFRKNNIEEDTRIALAIIQGIAEYAEFKVQKQKKLTKRQMMKQYVINSHMVRLCIMRCFHPEKLYTEIKSFISYFLGRNFTEQPPFEFPSIYRQTSKREPVLLMCGPNVNAYTELCNLKEVLLSHPDAKLEYQPLGQIANEKITTKIIKCACEGTWLLLDNLQLSLEIIANLQKFIENMVTFGKKIRQGLMTKAKLELKDILYNKKSLDESNNNDQDSNIAMELMLLEQSIMQDKTMETTFNPNKMDDTALSENITGEDKTASISVSLQTKLKFLIAKKKTEARQDVMDELDDYEKQRKIADEKSEIRELSHEEKYLQEMVFPESLAFPIHKKFRLFISVIPVPNFPANFARRCLKISLELPVNIRPNTIKSFNIIPPHEVANVNKNQREFKRMLFSMTVMHAVINHRERFGSFGWTQPYHFSPNDLQITIKMLGEICQKINKGQNFPLKLMRYLVGVLNYGGKLTNKEDQLILSNQVKTFINMRVFEDATIGNRSAYARTASMLDEHQPGQLYDLTGCQSDPLRPRNAMGDRAFQIDDGNRIRSYLMPLSVDHLRGMRDHVRDNFPLEDMPEIFGLHHNATVKATTDIATEIMYRTYIYQFVIKRPKQPALTQVQTNRRNSAIYEYFRGKLKEIIYRIPSQIPADQYEEQIPIEREKPFNTLLVKEIARYNILIGKVELNLTNTLDAMEGLIQHNTETENTFECLQQERTPMQWFQFCYPCHTNMTKFIDNLNDRIRYIRELLDLASSDNFTIRKFWMPGFFNQRNLLTTLMQEVARKQRISIEQLTISFRIMDLGEKQFSQIKAEGTNSYYIDGLFLYGAIWNEDERSIMDPNKHSQIGNPLPMLHLMIERQSFNTNNESDDDIIQECLSTEEYQTQLYKETHYLCPMFVNFTQNRILNNQSAEGQLITTVPIPVKYRKPNFWIKRNICILCYNESSKE